MTKSSGQVLYLVSCAAPPVLHLTELIEAAQADDWEVCLALTPIAATWSDIAALANLTGHAVRHGPRHPAEVEAWPAPSAVLVAPVTFNTLNKWAAGISDSVALGLLNEAIGQRMPVVAAPYAKESLASHPAYRRSVSVLRDCGVQVLMEPQGLEPKADTDPLTFTWHRLLTALGNQRGSIDAG